MGGGCRMGHASIPVRAGPCDRVTIGAGSRVPGPGGPGGRAWAGSPARLLRTMTGGELAV